MRSLTSSIPRNLPLLSSNNSNIKTQRYLSNLQVRAANQKASAELVLDHKKQHHQSSSSNNHSLLESISSFVHHLHLDSNSNNRHHPQFIDWNSTPILSPKEEISTQWLEILGSSTDFDNIIDPILEPWLRREIIKYGEFAQATYDGFDFDSHSEYCGSCRYSNHKFFDKLGLTHHGYNVTKYIYAMSHVDVPKWLERSHLVDTWSKDSNWMGYVAVSDDHESRRLGRRDIVIAWRGTVAPSEWYEDLQGKLEPIANGSDVKVEHGFLDIYKSKSNYTRYNKTSASEQVIQQIMKLVKMYKQKGEEVGITITGHSLGGALALINAFEIASLISNIPINVISFGAPRVGNIAFRDKLHEMGVKTLRVTMKQDVVTKMPGILFNEGLQVFDEITGTLDWVYTHVGAELKLDVRDSPYLKQGFNLLGFHSLETYLHLVDGYVGGDLGFRKEAKRDVALVNKGCGMLVDALRIPECWYQLENKGLVRNSCGRWVKPSREPEDIPSSDYCIEQEEQLSGYWAETVPCFG